MRLRGVHGRLLRAVAAPGAQERAAAGDPAGAARTASPPRQAPPHRLTPPGGAGTDTSWRVAAPLAVHFYVSF